MEIIVVSNPQQQLFRLAEQIGDTRIPNKALAVQLTSWVDRNFKMAGGFVGGWAPLKPSTLRQKQRKGYSLLPLITTGRALTLQRSFAASYDSVKAGIGTEKPYSVYHEEGAPPRLAQRRMLPSRSEGLDMGIRVYQYYINKSIRGTGL